jgi:hypothetical protein
MKKKSVAVAVAVVGAVAVAGDGDDAKRDEYMPANGRGYSMFPKGIPDFVTLFATPFKPMDVEVLRKMMTEMTHRFSDESVTWWNSLLDNIESEDASACTVCQAYRVQSMKNASHCHDGDDLRKEKSRAYRKATKELARHMASSGDGAHSRFVPRSGGELLPPGRFLENNDVEEEEQVFSNFFVCNTNNNNNPNLNFFFGMKIPEFSSKFFWDETSGIFFQITSLNILRAMAGQPRRSCDP